MKFFSYKSSKAKTISLNEIFDFWGRTTSETMTPRCISFFLKRNRQWRLKRLRETALPYFLETMSPRAGWDIEIYLNDKSPINRDLEIFIIWLNSDEDKDRFNYTEISLRPLFRRRAKIARPPFVPILFLNPCLFLRLRLVYLIVTFIKNPFS